MSLPPTPLPGIASRAWEHPADRLALSALKRIPGLDAAIRGFSGLTGDKALRLFFLASSIRVSEKQYGSVHRLLLQACETLDQNVPELYISNHPVANAGAFGIEKPFILLHSALLQQLDDEGLLFVIGHELGHIASGHSLYRTMVELALHLGRQLSGNGLPPLLAGSLMMSLMEWYRKSELSADRAGMLVCQNSAAAYRSFMALAGGMAPANATGSEVSLSEFMRQAEDYRHSDDVADDLWKILNLIGQTHPFPILRLAELKPWAESDAYTDILGGKYPQRTGESSGWKETFEDLASDAEEAKKAYQQEFSRSSGPLKDGVEKVVHSVEEATKQAEKLLKNLFERK